MFARHAESLKARQVHDCGLERVMIVVLSSTRERHSKITCLSNAKTGDGAALKRSTSRVVSSEGFWNNRSERGGLPQNLRGSKRVTDFLPRTGNALSAPAWIRSGEALPLFILAPKPAPSSSTFASRGHLESPSSNDSVRL
jgi:hypothetical protein